LAFLVQPVPDGVMVALSTVVPPDELFILNANPALALAPAPLYLTPICTTFIIESVVINAGVSSMLTSSTAPLTLEAINVVASSGVTSSISVLLPVQPPLSPVALGLK
jgi:hypothetical protein